MSKFNFGNGQYVVYARNEQEARQVISQELQRVDKIREKVASLLSENGIAMQNFMENVSEENLNIHFNDETSLIYDDPENATTKGEVRQRNFVNGKFTYDLAYRYPDINGHNADFRLAHEMGHLVLNPANAKRQTYDKNTDSRQVSGLIRRTEDGKFYGLQVQENAINLIAELAVRGEHRADDIITGKVDVSEFNLYKKADDLVKLLAVSMRNDFDKEMSFEQLVEQKIDSFIEHSDGTREPANTFFYGVLNDSSIIENEFDKYMGKGAWRDLDTFITNLHNPNISKEQFNMVFKEAQEMITEFANTRFQDKHRETVVRNGGFNVPNLENKLEMIKEMTGIENQRTSNRTSASQQQSIEMPEGYSINEFEEIIKPTRNEETHQFQSQQTQEQPQLQEQGYTNTRFGAVINSNSYSEHLQPISQQNKNKLSLKQRVAQFLQKNNLFMNLSFVDKFVHKQLDVLPEPTQEIIESNTTRENNTSTTNRTRESFINELTNFGAYRNLPPIQRMSDPKKIEEMRKKMEQQTQTNDNQER